MDLRRRDKVQFEMGMLTGGWPNGRWIAVRVDDSSGEELYYSAGPYVDGQRYGRWVIRFPDGQIEEGPYERGQQHGQWNIRFADGDTGEGPYSMVRDTDGGSIARMTGVAARCSS